MKDASQSHYDTVTEEEQNGKLACYRLVRQKMNTDPDDKTDIGALQQGNISITPLHIQLLNKASPAISDSLFSDLLQELGKC